MKSFLRLHFFLTFWILMISAHSFSQVDSVQNSNPIVRMYDSLNVEDGYILLMLERTCSLMNRKGEVLFNIPGNLATFYDSIQEIVTHNGNSLVVYNKDLDVLWKIPGYIEHELMVTKENNIMFFSGDYKNYKDLNIYFNNIISVDSLRKKTVKWSTLEQRHYLIDFIMKDTSIFLFKINGSKDPDSVLSKIAPSLERVRIIPIQINSPNDSIFPSNTNRELFHMNSIQVIPENNSEKKDSVFKKGNILLCFNNFSDSIRSFIAIVDPVNFKILWHFVQKDGRGIHTPAMLPNGHILFYANMSFKVHYSSIEEIDPLTQKVVWSYKEYFPESDPRYVMGSCQRLPNGNTFISNILGYVYEVTPDKKIAWLWRSELLSNKKPKFLYRAFFYPKENLKWLELEK